MRVTKSILISSVAALLLSGELNARTPSGFYLPDSLEEVTVGYQSVDNLVVLRVIINDSIRANLVLDTGCRNLVLFGKRFRRMFGREPVRQAVFSGLGRGNAVTGDVFLGNEVRLDRVTGQQIPIVVVGDRGVFRSYRQIDGVIGYDIFMEFETELNPGRRTITFRTAENAPRLSDFSYVSLRVNNSCPVIQSQVELSDTRGVPVNLMIDTGSVLGLFLKKDDLSGEAHDQTVIGYGFNGPLSGYNGRIKRLTIADHHVRGVVAAFCPSTSLHDGSLGMAILKDYVLILNYCRGYAAFKRLGT